MRSHGFKNKITSVLIADDDPDDFELMAESIHEVDQTILIARACDGNQLLDMLEGSIPDLLFLDIGMPCRDGKGCLMEIRAQRRFDNMRIVICTGSSNEDLVAFCMEHGADLLMNKPNSYDELVMLVKKILSSTFATRVDFVISGQP